MKYILDACAVLAYLKNENGADVVEKLFTQAEIGEASILGSIINLLEVYYDRLKTKDDNEVNKYTDFLNIAPIKVIDFITQPVYHEAARLKANYKISLADSILVATGINYNAIIVTADHHELGAVEENESISFLWIR